MLGDRDYMRPGTPYGMFSTGWKEKSMVNRLILINIVIFILQYLLGLTSYLWLSGNRVTEFWRLVSYMFAHGNIPHILFNMWQLYVLGKAVEQRLGPSTFLKLYLTSGVVGGLSWMICDMVWANAQGRLVGASGAIFGIMAAAAMLFPKMQVMLLFPPVVLEVRTLVICLAVINVLVGVGGNDNVAQLAHLGGLVAGFLFVKRLLSHKRPRQRHVRRSNNVNGFGSIVQNMKTSLEKTITPKRDRTPDLRFVEDDRSTDDDEIITSQIDPILDKIGKYGMQSLTLNERKILEKARERLKDRS